MRMRQRSEDHDALCWQNFCIRFCTCLFWERNCRRLFLRQDTGGRGGREGVQDNNNNNSSMVPPSQQGAYASPRLGVPFGEVQPPSSLSLMNSNSRNNKGSSPPARVPFRNRPFPCRGGRTGKSDAGLKSEYNATVEGLACSPVATILNGSAIATATPALHKARRSTPLVQWVWPLNTGASAAPRLSSENKGFGRQRRQQQQENPVRSQQKGVSGKTQQVSSVVTGKICEPVRPRRLDLSVTQGENEIEGAWVPSRVSNRRPPQSLYFPE